MKFIKVVTSKQNYDKNWLITIYNQLSFENYISNDLWHKYVDDKIIKNAKFSSCISAQKLEAKVNAIIDLMPSLIKQARIYTDFSCLISNIYFNSIKDGGASIYIDTGISVNKNNSGYMVAKQDSKEKVLSNKEFTPYEIERYVKENMNQLKQDNTFLGTWSYQENWYLDSSEKIESCILAMKLAIDRNQIAIYDLERQKSIYTKDFNNIKFSSNKELWFGKSNYEDLLKLKQESEKI